MSQTKEILRELHLRPITPLYALQKFGCMRLAARIKDLRQEGYNIVTTQVQYAGKKFASYRLVQKRKTI